MEINGHTRIYGIGGYVPTERVKSVDLLEELHSSSRFGIRETFISDVIGIKERRVAARDEKPSDLAIAASRVAMTDAGIMPSEIDLVIFCGIERDWQEPATAHRVQQVLGMNKAACFDVTNACHGFMNGLSIADAMIATGSAETALVCTGEKPTDVMYQAMSRLKQSHSRADMKNWIGGLTVGDAGGAVVVSRSSSKSGFKKFVMSSNGDHTELCYYKHTDTGMEGCMEMSNISTEMIRFHQSMIDGTYRSLLWKAQEVDHLVCHQVGHRPHRKMASVADVDIKKAPVTYNNYGNITSATIPVNLYLNPPNKGDKVLILGAGSGLSVSQTGMVF